MLHSAFSSSPPITQWSLVFYTIIYTSLPTIVVAMLDRGLDPATLLKYPALYKAGQRNDSYNKPLFWVTMLDTLWQSLVLFYVPFLTHQQSTIDIWSLGSLWTIAIMVLVNVHLAMDVQHFTWVIHAAFLISVAATYACVIALDVVNDETQAHYWYVSRAFSAFFCLLFFSFCFAPLAFVHVLTPLI
jgi:phospholipid-transporting ATPase